MNRRELFGMGRAFVPGLQREDGGTDSSLPLQDYDNGLLPPFVPADSDPWDYAKAAHLLRRAMIGPTEIEIRTAVAEGLDLTISRLMQPFEPDLDLIADFAGRDPEIGSPPPDSPELDIWRAQQLGRRERLGRWWLQTIASSPVSIQERMTLFWHGHFISEMPAVEFAEFMYPQIRLFRTSALGNLRRIVADVTVDMAMLIYLSGTENRVEGDVRMVNENYARELMELFTMGPVNWEGEPNYTLADVQAAARSLSGWWYRLSPDGEYHRSIHSRFTPERWDPGIKTFMGHTGVLGSADIIDIIFARRGLQVARFICEKIYRNFVNLAPNRSVIDAMARLLVNSNWEIRPLMEALLKSAHFYLPDNIGALHRSSVDYHVGLIRTLGAGAVPDFTPGVVGPPFNDLMFRLQRLGHMPLFPPNVKGWPGGRNWTNMASLPLRQRFATELAEGKIEYSANGAPVQGYTYDPIAFARTFSDPGDISRLCDEMARCILPVPPSQSERAQLYAALLDGGVDYEWSISDPDQRPAHRIRRFLKAACKLPKHQLY